MESLAQRKKEIDETLQRETANLARLRESLQRSDQASESMIGILTTFEGRLERLEKTIIPIYQSTGILQRRQTNVDNTLVLLDEVIEYYHVVRKTEGVMKESPRQDIDRYLSCMDQLKAAEVYFEMNHPGSPELSAVINLFMKGQKSLEREFQEVLARHSRPVPSVIIMDLLNEDEADQILLEHLPEDIKNDLYDITKWLAANTNSHEFTGTYVQIRSNILLKSITGVKDHIKSGSSGGGSVSAAPHSPGPGRKFGSASQSTPSKRTSLKKFAFPRKASAMLMNFSAQIMESTTGHKRQGSTDLDSGLEENLCIDVEVYVNTISVIQRLIQSERSLLEAIIPEKSRRKSFDALINLTLTAMVTEGEQLATSVKRSTGKKDFSGVISLLPVVKHLRSVRMDFDRLLEGCQQATRTKIASLLSNLNSTGAKGLEDFIEFVRNDSDKASNIPRDGTVHQLTSNTLIFLEQMLDFNDAAGGMLMTLDPTAVPGQQDPKKNKKKLAEYIVRVLSTLRLNLTNKAQSYSDSYLGSIFMVNNANYILKSLRKTQLLPLANLLSSETEMIYEEEIRENKRQYLVSFNKVIPHIVEHYGDSSVQRPGPGPTMKLTEKDRQNIKDKFSGFNKEIEELWRVQKGYAIPDADLHKVINAENREYVLPKYKVFLNKYKDSHFTKNPQKYIKYTAEDGQTVFLDRFFDASA